MYHTFTRALILLSQGESIWDHSDDLISRWFLVPVSFDEQKWVTQIQTIAAALQKKKDVITTYTVFTTTDCNARCYYCYELHYKRVHMTEQTAHDTADYIVRTSKGQEVKLHWFGGEPLYNRRAIDIITSDLRAQKIPFHSVMTSNGYYLDAETVFRAVHDWHLRWVQITLDGTKDVYNKTKSYIEKNCNAFERVLSNIGKALNAGIQVTVRLNVDGHNADDLLVLCKELSDRFGGRKGFTVYPEQLRAFEGPVRAFQSEHEAAEKFIALQDAIISLGLNAWTPLERKLRINNCMADDDGSIAIYPDGRLCKCEHFKDSQTVGSIYSDSLDRTVLTAWKETIRFPECDGCALYPTCVNLKCCKWSDAGCSESRRMIKRYKLEQQILAAWREAQQA